MSARLNVLRLRRGRSVGFGMIGIMVFLVLGFVFLTDEPLTIEITEEIDFQICPPYCDEAFFELPIPEFEPRTLSMTPIVTVTDDLGISTTIRGETTFLEGLIGLDIALQGLEDQTFNDGTLKIELEFVTDKITDESITVLGELDVFSPASPEIPEGIAVIQVCPPQCGNVLLSTTQITSTGLTEGGVFVTQIYNERINTLVSQNLLDGTYLARFQLNELNIMFDTEEFTLPQPVTEPLVIYDLFYTLTGLTPTIDQIIIENQTIPMNATESPIEQVIVPDVPNSPCFETTFDSISFLFPTIEISGTTNLWDSLPNGDDIINVDLRNNRNCELQLAIGSQWRSTTGETFVSTIDDITILTNQTVPFKSVPFDSTLDCGGSCAGQQVQFCFFGQVSIQNPIEVINEFCGSKFFR